MLLSGYEVAKNMFQEATLVLYDGMIIDVGIGESSSVEFDFLTVWNAIKKHEFTGIYSAPVIYPWKKGVLHFFHTHESNTPLDFYSALDVQCMKGLNIAFGFSVSFWILTLDAGLIQYKLREDMIQKIQTIYFDDFEGSTIDGIAVTKINKLLSKLSLPVHMLYCQKCHSQL